MNSSTKLLSGIALLMSLTAYASAGAMDDLKGNVPDSIVSEIKVDMPAPTRNAVGHMPAGDQKVKYLTNVSKSFLEELVPEFFAGRTRAVNIAHDLDLHLPSRPISSEHQDLFGQEYTVLIAEARDVLPATNWETLTQYKATEFQLPLLMRYVIVRDMGLDVLEIIKHDDGTYMLRVKQKSLPACLYCQIE